MQDVNNHHRLTNFLFAGSSHDIDTVRGFP